MTYVVMTSVLIYLHGRSLCPLKVYLFDVCLTPTPLFMAGKKKELLLLHQPPIIAFMDYAVETAVVILNWNGKDFLEKFLPKVVEYTCSADTQVIIADNHSDDDSVAFLEAHYPQLRLIRNAENGGFAKGYNDALKQVNARFYVLLNSDIEVTPDWVAPVIRKMKADPMVGAAQPKLLSYFQKDRFEYAGAAGGFIDRLGYPFCRGRIFDHTEPDQGQYEDEREIFWATGAALFVRSDLFRALGGLDADFFAHMEEIDFCWRLHNAGYKVMYYPCSTLYHIGGGTLPKSSPTKTYLNFRNNLALLYKNLPKKKLWSVFCLRFWMDAAAAMLFLLKRQGADFRAVCRAYRDFYRQKKRHRVKRKTITQRPYGTGVYRKSIVAQYYLRRKTTFTALSPEDFGYE